MNWEAISAASEMIGATAVVLSLIYLAVQVRHSANTTQDSATRDIFIAVSVQLGLMAEASNKEILLRVLLDYSNAEPSDRYTFDSLMTGFITLAESIFISAGSAIVSDESMENFAFYLRTRYMPYPGMREWWEGSRGTYVVPAQEWIERQFESTDQDSDYWQIK